MTRLSFQQVPVACRQLLGEGRREDALTVVDAFLENGTPHFPAMKECFNAARSGQEQRRVDGLLEKLSSRFPDELQGWLLHIQVYQQRRDWRRLLDALEQARRCGGPMDRIELWRAEALQRLLRPEAALEALAKTHPGAGQPGVFEYVRAQARLQLKQYAESIDELREFLAQAPENFFVAGCWKVLGSMLDREGYPEEAFEAFSRGNRMASKLAGADEAGNPLGIRIGAFREIVTPAWYGEWGEDPEAPDAEDSPVFLIGFPRSGTTLLEQVLDAHPRVSALEEKHTVEAVWQVLWAYLERPKNLPEEPVARQAALLRGLSRLGPATLKSLRDVYREAVAGHLDWREGQVLVDKMPLNTSSLPLLVRLFPRSRFIVSLRHPCDVLLSNFMQKFEMNPAMEYMMDLDRSAGLYVELMELLEQSRQAMDLDQRLHLIRYEDLVTDFEPRVRAMLAFLGLEWDPAVTRYHEHARGRGTLATPSYQGVASKLYSHALNRWHRYAVYLAGVTEQLHPVGQRFGYSFDTDGCGRD